MAWYHDPEFIVQWIDALFDKLFRPGARTPHSGIHRCEGCGREIASAYPRPLPREDHHPHTPAQESMRWRLIVAVVHR